MPTTVTGDLSDIVIGRRWPSDGTIWYTVTYSDGAPAGVDGWEWILRVSRVKQGGDPLIEIDSLSVAESSDVVTIGFVATATETAALTASGKHWVSLVSRPDTDNEAEREATAVNASFGVGESA